MRRPGTLPQNIDGWPRYGLLLAALVASVAVLGAIPAGNVQEIVAAALLGISLILAFRVAGSSPQLLLLGYLLAAGAVAAAVVRVSSDALGAADARLVSAVLVALGPPAVIRGVLRNLRATRGVSVQALMGVLSVYMLVGMLFAFVYAAIDRLGGSPFFVEGPATVANCIYYSFTTLATVGYGDLTSRTDLGHTLSIFEALTGQIYLVTVVSLIVANLRPRPSAG